MASVNVYDMEAIKSKMVSPAKKANSGSNNNANSKEEYITFIIDQEPGFEEVADSEGWNHIYDCKHYPNDIMKYWGGLETPPSSGMTSIILLILLTSPSCMNC